MPLSLRTRLSAVEPPNVALTVAGHARIRVRGNAYGCVLLGRELRWAFGAFDHTFRVARTSAERRVLVLGLGGFASTVVRFLAPRDLTVRVPQVHTSRVSWSRVRIPRIAPLSRETIRQGVERP